MNPFFPNAAVNRNLAPFLALSAALVLPAAADTPQVKVVTPKPATANRAFEIPGRTEPAEQASIFSRATGTVRELTVDIGDRRKAGEVLAVIDAPEIDRQIDAAQAAVEQSEARAQSARSVATRSAGLLDARAVSREQSELLSATAAEFDANVRATKAELERLKELQKFATVRAPFDGRVTARNIDRGDHVRGDSSSATDWLFQFSRLNELRVVVEASPDIALRVEQGQVGVVRFPELAGRSFEAKVSRTSHVFERSSGTMRVELLLKNDDFLLPAGLVGTVTFDLKPAPGTLLVPGNALLVRGGKSMVGVVDQGKVRFLEVVPGRNTGDSVEVTSAALGSLPVMVSPNAMIREGDAVEASVLEVKPKK